MAKAKTPPFEAIHRHGFVRVASATPLASSGDVTFNVEQAIALAREADRRGGEIEAGEPDLDPPGRVLGKRGDGEEKGESEQGAHGATPDESPVAASLAESEELRAD